MQKLIYQFISLCCFVLLMGFTFCDGYKLHTARKLIWFVLFLAITISVFKIKKEFSLELILPIPCLLAFVLGWYELKIKKI